MKWVKGWRVKDLLELLVDDLKYVIIKDRFLEGGGNMLKCQNWNINP